MADERGVVKYQARDGQEVTLSFQNVKQYLVSGGGSVTDQELMYFLGVCKSRGLNPFKKDAYLIKYGTNDPAAIVTSIDYFRSRARSQPDCIGWKKGIVVQRADGSLRDSAGLILEGEKLIGGFFEAQPEGWKTPFRIEVNLEGYIKKTRDGKTTRFWEKDNQPTMIAKVAEGQGLRTLWPDEFQGIYEEAEIKAPAIDMSKVQNGSFEKKEKIDTSAFDDLVSKSDIPDGQLAMIEKFVAMSAKALSKTPDEVKLMAVENFDDFLIQFKEWIKKNPDPPKGKGAAPEKSSAEKTVSSETSSTAAAGTLNETAISEKQGPQPPPGQWDPMTADLLQRYSGDKARALIEHCKDAGIEFAGLTPKEMHEKLKASSKIESKEPSATSVKLDDIFKDKKPEEKLKLCSEIMVNMENSNKDLFENIVQTAADETGLTRFDVQEDVEMFPEFVMFCLSCYKQTGNDYKVLIPNGK